MSVQCIESEYNGNIAKCAYASDEAKLESVRTSSSKYKSGSSICERTHTLTTSNFAASDLDLDVADEQLLAADGVLTLGKCSSNRTVIGYPSI